MALSREHLRILAPAKINLHLRVGPPRVDGYHPLLSWMCTAGLFDALTFETLPSPGIELSTNVPSLPVDRSNLIVLAAEALASVLTGSREAAVGGVRITLEKRIPLGAGLGGGSSDGAATLMALNRLWGANRSQAELANLAAQLGSDLPFFFFSPSGLCGGRGEVVHPIAPPAPRWAVLILPDLAMPTPAVYRRFDELGLGRESGSLFDDPMPAEALAWERWSALPAEKLLAVLQNDLEPAAFSLEPPLGHLRDELEQDLGRIVRMSGSGSSLFTLCDDEAESRRLSERARRRMGRALSVELAVQHPAFQLTGAP